MSYYMFIVLYFLMQHNMTNFYVLYLLWLIACYSMDVFYIIESGYGVKNHI